MNHEGLTHMLFVDAIVGVGFPAEQAAIDAERGGLATLNDNGRYTWNRRILDTLSVATLQDLYTGLKLHEVTHAG